MADTNRTIELGRCQTRVVSGRRESLIGTEKVKGPVTPAGHDLQRRDDGRWGSNACQNQEESDLAICLEFGLLASV